MKIEINSFSNMKYFNARQGFNSLGRKVSCCSYTNVPVNRASSFKVFPDSGIFLQVANFFICKYLQIALLLIIFVDILPKVSAVDFAEFFHL